MSRRYYLGLLVFAVLSSCMQRQTSSSMVKDEVTTPSSLAPEIFFNFPGCVPHCTADDKVPANQNSYMQERFTTAFAQAKKQIDFSMYNFSLQPVYQALVAAAERGVIIRGIVDKAQFVNLGSTCTPAGCELAAPFNAPEYLRKTVAERRAYLDDQNLWPTKVTLSERLVILLYKLPNGSTVKPAPGSYLVHHKLAMVDGDWLLTGSGNWSSVGLSMNIENLSILSAQEEKSVLSSFQCMFDTVWTGDAAIIAQKLKGCQTDNVYFTPMSEKEGITIALVKAIDASQKTIDVMVNHLTNYTIIDALERALKRGVKFRFVIDDDNCNVAIPPQIQKLINAKADIRYMGTNCTIFQLSHNKFGIFDGKLVMNGSGNWSRGGLTSNYENFVIYDRPHHVASFQNLFEKAWNTAVPRATCSCDTTKPECRTNYCLDRLDPNP